MRPSSLEKIIYTIDSVNLRFKNDALDKLLLTRDTSYMFCSGFTYFF